MKSLDNYQLKLIKAFLYSFKDDDRNCALCVQEVYINLRTIDRLEHASDHFEWVDEKPKDEDFGLYSSNDFWIAYTEDDNWYLIYDEDAKNLIMFGDVL